MSLAIVFVLALLSFVFAWLAVHPGRVNPRYFVVLSMACAAWSVLGFAVVALVVATGPW